MRIRFSDLELDDERFLLLREGRALAIRPKVFDLLVHLVRFRERVVLREELVLALWGTTAVGLGSLSGLVNELRQILGEAGRDSSSIRTVHARGYQFVAEVEGRDSGAAVPGSAHEAGRIGEIESTDRSGTDAEDHGVITQIRGSLNGVTTGGPRLVLIEGSASPRRGRLLDAASREATRVGFASYRFSLASSTAAESQIAATFFFDRLLDALIESHGIERVRALIPIRAHEVRERVRLDRATRDVRPCDPLSACQYDEQIWRGTRELLGELGRKNPIALILEEYEPATTKISPRALLDCAADAPVLFLAAFADGSQSRGATLHGRFEEDEGHPGIDWLRLAPIDRESLNALLEARGVRRLPAMLADALLAHVEKDGVSLDCIVDWMDAASGDPPANPLDQRAPKHRMRRVDPARARRLDTGV